MAVKPRPVRVFKGVTKELRKPAWFWECRVCPPTRGRPVGGSHAITTFTRRWRKDYPPADVRARRAGDKHVREHHPELVRYRLAGWWPAWDRMIREAADKIFQPGA